MANYPANAADDGTIVVPVVREELQVGIHTVDTGRGVRVHKKVTEQVRHIDQTLTRNSVEVRRVAIDKIVALSEAPGARQEGDTLIIPVLEEVLVLEKRLRIKEEIHISTTAHAEAFTDSVVLRAEDVDIERFDDGAGSQEHPNHGGNHATHTRSRI